MGIGGIAGHPTAQDITTAAGCLAAATFFGSTPLGFTFLSPGVGIVPKNCIFGGGPPSYGFNEHATGQAASNFQPVCEVPAVATAAPTSSPVMTPSTPASGGGASLPMCYCDNFRNGLTTDDVGLHACSKVQDGQVDCIGPQRPWIPFIDSGCSSDRHRCHLCPLY